MKIVKINIEGNMNEINIDNIKILENVNVLYYWKQFDIIIKCYGNYCNDDIIYNQHELPPGGISIDDNIESDEIKINSDIYICMFKNDILQDYTISQYGELVYIMNEQYEFESDGDSVNDDDLKLDDFNKINIDSILKIDTNIFQSARTNI